MNHWVLSKLILSQQTNMDCVDSYWFNWIKCNESCQNDSIEVVRSRFIRNMWFVDSSVYNHKQHIEYTIKQWIPRKPIIEILIFKPQHKWFSQYVIPYWLVRMGSNDLNDINNNDNDNDDDNDQKERKKEEYCYAIQYNDRFQLIQWSNIMISWISIDSIAKQPLRLQCVWVIVPFGRYQWIIRSILYHW